MIKKALVAVLLCVMGLTALAIGNAEAGWYTCTIQKIGSSDTTYLVSASDTAANASFMNRWFVIDKSQGMEKQMLATILTAFSNGSNVDLYVSTTAAYSTAWSAIASK